MSKPFNPMDSVTLSDVLTGLKFLRAKLATEGIEAIFNDFLGDQPKIKVREIQRGDTYSEDGKLVWTALRDVEDSSFGGWSLGVRYQDRSRGLRAWENEDGDFEVPGLERP